MMALVIAMVMVVGTLSLAGAATNNLTNDAKLTVSGLEAGDTVYYYQVLQWNQNTGWGFTTQFADLADSTTPSTAYTAAMTAVNADTSKSPRVTNVLEYITGLPAKLTQAADGTVTVATGDEAVAGKINAALAGEIAKLATTPVVSGGEVLTGSTWEANVAQTPAAAGLYLVLVAAGKSGVVYNPIFVASDYYNTETGAQPVANTTDTWAVDLQKAYSDQSLAKRTDITVEKTVQDADNTDLNNAASTNLVHENSPAQTNDEAAAVGVNSIVMFTVETIIPAYATNYADIDTEKLVFNVYDKLSTGLELVVDGTHPVTVKAGAAGSEDVITGEDKYTVVKSTGTDLEIDFANAYIKGVKSPQSVIITYYAKVTNAALTNVNTDNNTVQVEYSNNPNNLDQVGIIKDVTNQYTFSIDADALGITGYENSELVKIGVDKDGNIVTSKKLLDNGEEVGALQGAIFGLYKDSECTDANQIGEYTTDANGKINIKGLDVGTYYLKEKSAPNGYIPDTSVKTITISAEFETRNVSEEVSVTKSGKTVTNQKETVTYETKVLKSYTVQVQGVSSTYTMSYSSETQTSGFYAPTGIVLKNTSVRKLSEPAYSAGSDKTFQLLNTQGTQLPATGGMGTTLFYAIGVILVIGAGILLVSKRRMSAN